MTKSNASTAGSAPTSTALDAAINWGNGKAYLFNGDQYIRYDIASDKADSGYPLSIQGNWSGLTFNQIDAVINWGNGKAYFFNGEQYTRYDIASDRADSGYPKPIAGNWSGLTFSQIDAIINWGNGKAYIFSGTEYTRYDIASDKADSGYPKPIAGNWSGLSFSSLTAAINWGNNKAYLFDGDQYVRYDIPADKEDSGYPLPVQGNWPGLSFSPSNILNVKLFPQLTNMWCWAASGQMMMDYLGKNVDQCTQANQRFGLTTCCNTPTPSDCVKGGWPNFPNWGFSVDTTTWGTALSFSQLKQQIDNNQPVGFSWGWTGGGGHMMVARGYMNSPQLVLINNPWAPNVGDIKWITYSDYVSGSNHVHWRDYYNLVNNNNSSGGAAMNTESSKNTGTQYPDAGGAAAGGMQIFPQLVNANHKEMGFSSPLKSADELSLGEALHVYHVRHDELKAHNTERSAQQLLNKVDELIYPVLHKGEVVSSIVVGQVDQKWSIKSIGDSNLIKDICETRDRHAEAAGHEGANYAVVQIPSLFKSFIAHENKEQELLLTPLASTQDSSAKKSRRGDQVAQSAQDIIGQLQTEAQADNHALD